jgi:hypothetical protein
MQEQKQMPAYQPQQQQIQQTQEQIRQQRALQNRRRSSAIVTRVLGDLMVFVKVKDETEEVGLVFKPDKINDYRGEHLQDLGVIYNATIPEVVWDAETMKVTSVQLEKREDQPRFASL